MRARIRSALVAAVAALVAACADRSSPTSPVAGADVVPPSERPSLAMVANGSFRETFNFPEAQVLNPGTGRPDWALVAPAPWRPTDFDVTVHSRDPETWYRPERFRAMHGTRCQPFQTPEPANAVQAGDLGSHEVHAYEDLNYRCRNHMMTAIQASGYGMIYVTPNALVDFGGGEAVVKFALSTLRTSGRDWVDLWITPWEDNLKLPLDAHLPDVQGPPRRAIHVRMTAEKSRSAFEAYYVDDFREVKLPVADAAGYERILRPVSTRRDTFELRISRTRLRFGMSKLASPNEPAGSMRWIDTPIPALSWTRGVLQFGHHSFNPALDGGTAGTWHWDDFALSPAVPFTIINASRRYVDQASARARVDFPRPAPANARLRFAAWGEDIQVSVDGGRTWSDARRQRARFDRDDRFHSYWTPVPAGTSSVLFRSGDADDDDEDTDDEDGAGAGRWIVRDIAIWSLTAG